MGNNGYIKMPSATRLMSTFGISRADANLLRSIGHAVDNADTLRANIDLSCPETAAYVRTLYSDPYTSHMWRVTVALHAMDVILGTHGVEALGGSSDSVKAPPFEYLNAGDTYATTLVFCRASCTITIATWGDIAERHPSWA